MKVIKKEYAVVFSMIVLAVASRLLPHPPNFAPITGIALFAASKLNKKIVAFLLPLCCLFITDLILGLSWINLFVYGAFVMISLIGMRTKRVSLLTVLGSSLLFFIVSNFGVWLLYYPLTLEGLVTCFYPSHSFLWKYHRRGFSLYSRFILQFFCHQKHLS